MNRVELRHALGEALRHFAAIENRAALERDARYRSLRPEIDRVLHGFEWDLSLPDTARKPALLPRAVRVAAWNVERGKRFDALLGVLRDDPILRDVDLLMLNEVDIGMGRSFNKNVPREVALALGMRYVFANSHLVLAPGDSGERNHGRANELGLHGNALLSRFPLRRFEAVTLPERTDKFHALEKRLGEKRAIVCDVLLPDGPLTVAVVHLDPFASAHHRARQLTKVAQRIDARSPARVLLGGDLNTTTYNFGSKLGLLRNIGHKFLRFGFVGTIEQYMVPENVFERPVFNALEKARLSTLGLNDKTRGTVYYDVNDPEIAEKTVHYVPQAWWSWLQRRMEPWGGIVPLRLDWFAGRGVKGSSPTIIERPSWNGVRVSDHNPIVVDLELGPPIDRGSLTD